MQEIRIKLDLLNLDLTAGSLRLGRLFPMHLLQKKKFSGVMQSRLNKDVQLYSQLKVLFLPRRWVLEICGPNELKDLRIWLGLRHSDNITVIWVISHLWSWLWELGGASGSKSHLDYYPPPVLVVGGLDPMDNTDHQAINHFQFSAFWMEGQGFSSFPLERQSYVLNIPGFSGDLHAIKAK